MHLVLAQVLAGGQVDRDDAGLVIGAQHRGLMGLNVKRGDVPVIHGRNYAALRSALRAIHSAPG